MRDIREHLKDLSKGHQDIRNALTTNTTELKNITGWVKQLAKEKHEQNGRVGKSELAIKELQTIVKGSAQKKTPDGEVCEERSFSRWLDGLPRKWLVIGGMVFIILVSKVVDRILDEGITILKALI